MFILVTDKESMEKARLEAAKFDDGLSLLEAVRLSVPQFLSVRCEKSDKISLVLDPDEKNALEKYVLKLYGKEYSPQRLKMILGYVALEAVSVITFGDQSLVTAAENIRWKGVNGNDNEAPGISVFRVGNEKRYRNDFGF